ncbi:MAG: DUF3078 domain-containing protein [Weeksellaceae bacterium]
MVLGIPRLGNAQLRHVYNELKRIDFNPKDTITGWKGGGKLRLNANQSMYSNWRGGANNSVEVNALMNYQFNYQSKVILWDNYILADFGVNKLKRQKIRKTQDRLEYNSIIGVKLPGEWSASYFLNLQTQLTNSYDYENDLQKEHRINGFLAPLYATTGPGVMWRKSNNLHFNMAPFTYKLTYINGRIHRYNKASQTFSNDEQTDILGITAGKKFNYQLGFYSSALYRFNLSKNIKVENRLSLYSNYLDDFSNIDFDYTMRMNLRINDLISTQVTFQARYDDDAYAGLQAREALGVGVEFKL